MRRSLLERRCIELLASSRGCDSLGSSFLKASSNPTCGEGGGASLFLQRVQWMYGQFFGGEGSNSG
jgi:hypothetical protein